METTGEPVKIVLAPDRKVIAADGKDATVINVTAIDKKGREVPDAQSLIKFKVDGGAKIIGVGNGDPSCHEPDKYLDGNYQRSLFNGKCQLILQSGKAAGDVRVEASSEGLESGIANIQLK